MGKIKKHRHSRFKVYNGNINKSNKNPTENTAINKEVKNAYVNELCNLEAKVRLKACRMLSNIFAINSANIQLLRNLCIPELLSKLALRLVDVNLSVRVTATGAIRNLITCDDEVIINRLIDSGIFRTLSTLFMEKYNKTIPIINDDHYEQVIHCISNLISISEICLTNLLQLPNFILNICEDISSVIAISSENLLKKIKIFLALVNLLLIASDSNNSVCLEISHNNFIEKFVIVIRKIHDFIGLTETSVNIDELKYLSLQYIGVISNCYTTLISTRNMNINFYINDLLILLKSYMVIKDQDIGNLITYYTSNEPTILEDLKNNNDIVESTDMDENMDEPQTDEDSHVSGLKPSIQLVVSSIDNVKLISEIIANLSSVILDSTNENDENEDSDIDMELDDNEIDDQVIVESDNISASKDLPDYAASLVLLFKESNFSDTFVTCIDRIISTINGLISSSSNVSLTSSFIVFIDLLDTLIITSTNMLSINILTNNQVQQYLPLYLTVFELSYNIVTNITRSVDRDGKVIPTFPVHNSVNYKILTDNCNYLAISISEYINRYCKIIQFSIDNNTLQQIAILLMKNITLPTLEIIIISMETISNIINNNQIIVPNNINALLSNCIIRRMYDSASNSINQRNINICPIYLIDQSIMTIIDLHSEDSLELFEIYKNYKIQEKLTEIIEILQNKIKDNKILLEKNDQNKFKETIFNAKRFLKYKANFAKSLK